MQRRDVLTLTAVLLSVGLTLGLWWQTRGELQRLRAGQSRLTADLASARNLPIIDVSGDPALGPEETVVTLVEFSDYECPFCIRHFTQTMPRLAELIDSGQVRYVFRDLPIAQLHPGAARAHEAAGCAHDQGKFWQLHTRLFTPAGTHTDSALEAHAADAGLDADRFRECLTSGRRAADIKASVAEAQALGANGTPAFFLGVRDRATNRVEVLHAISGAQPFEAFKEAIAAVAERVGP